ncbi:MAG TPA: Mur ligase family protein [Candidatus Saccharimonadales bacterium]
MKQLITLKEATSAFLSYSPPSLRKYDLDRMYQLMELLGNPQNKLRVIHVAGTSGKTSTSYFIRAMLEGAGQKTGLTVSPHITGINERIQIGGLPLSEQKFLGYANQFFELLAASEIKPTYFELLVAMAYWVFAKEKVDYAVVETGLGGLLDGTNVAGLPDKVCVITDIGLDHTEILGETLAEIAFQKAGIIHPHNTVFIHHQSAEIIDVVMQSAQKNMANVHAVAETDGPQQLPLFQRRNWSLACAVFGFVCERDGLTMPQDLSGVTGQTPPGRWEQYCYNGKTIILDGAHNPQKLQALCDSMISSGKKRAAVMANFSEAPEAKIDAALRVLQPLAASLVVPEFSAGQDIKCRHSLASAQLAARARALDFPDVHEQPDIFQAFLQLLESPEDVLLITGSLYLVSAVRPLVIKTLQNKEG